MPYGRRPPVYRRRRVAIRRRRYSRRYRFNRRYTPRRFSGRTRQPLHNICRTLVGDSIDIGASQQSLAYSFQLSDLPSYTEFVALFQHYRINGIKITFVPPFNVSSVQDNLSSAFTRLPIIHSAPVYDNTAAPSDVNDLVQRSGYRRQVLKRPISFFIKPAMLLQGDDTSFDLTFWKRWVKTSNPSVNYYGYLFLLEAVGSGDSSLVQVYVKYYMQFKGIK